jgi:hypothetical protein
VGSFDDCQTFLAYDLVCSLTAWPGQRFSRGFRASCAACASGLNAESFWQIVYRRLVLHGSPCCTAGKGNVTSTGQKRCSPEDKLMLSRCLFDWTIGISQALLGESGGETLCSLEPLQGCTRLHGQGKAWGSMPITRSSVPSSLEDRGQDPAFYHLSMRVMSF